MPYTFDDLPRELKNEILKHLSASELFNARSTTKEFYALAYPILFKWQDEEAYSYQQKLMVLWITNPETRSLLPKETLINLVHQAFNNADINNANLMDNIYCLWLLADLNGQTNDAMLQSATTDCISTLITLSKDKVAHVRQEAWSTLDSFTPIISHDQKIKIRDAKIARTAEPTNGLTNRIISLLIKENALPILKALIPGSSNDQKIEIISMLISFSTDADLLIRAEAYYALSNLAPLLSDNQKTEIASTLIADIGPPTCTEAYCILSKFAPLLSDNQKTEIASALISLSFSNDIDPLTRIEAYYALSNFAPLLSDNQKTEIISALISFSADIQTYALNNFAPLLSAERINSLTQFSLDVGPLIRIETYYALSNFAPLLSDNQKTEIVNELIPLLAEEDTWHHIDADKILKALVPVLPETQTTRIITALIALLAHQNSSMSKELYNIVFRNIYISSTFSKTYKTKISNTLKFLSTKIDSSIRIKVCHLLAQLAPMLSDDQLLQIIQTKNSTAEFAILKYFLTLHLVNRVGKAELDKINYIKGIADYKQVANELRAPYKNSKTLGEYVASHRDISVNIEFLSLLKNLLETKPAFIENKKDFERWSLFLIGISFGYDTGPKTAKQCLEVLTQLFSDARMPCTMKHQLLTQKNEFNHFTFGDIYFLENKDAFLRYLNVAPEILCNAKNIDRCFPNTSKKALRDFLSAHPESQAACRLLANLPPKFSLAHSISFLFKISHNKALMPHDGGLRLVR